jgi:hypothetical protein
MISPPKKRSRSPLDRVAEIRHTIVQHPEISHRVHLQTCSQFLALAISHARDIAKCNQKDEARYWVRFLMNSRLLDILEHEEVEGMSQIRIDLSSLVSECHPADAPNYTSDLEAIRGHLEELLRLNRVESGIPALSVVQAKP